MIDVKTLFAINDFFQLSNVALIDIAAHAELLLLKKNSEIIAEETCDKKLYLLEGNIEILSDQLDSKTIVENTERSQKPFFLIHTAGLKAKCTCDSMLLNIESKVVERYVDIYHQDSTGIYFDELIKETNQDSSDKLVAEISEQFNSSEVTLPSLPEMALRVNDAVKNDSISLSQISKTLQSDPAIAARIVHVANSALFRTGTPIESLQSAISRIGLDAVRSIVFSVVLRDLFHPKSSMIKKIMHRYYAHSIRIAVISHVLAKHCQGFDPDHAFLSGLLHDIGVIPILVISDEHDELSKNPGVLDTVLINLKGTIGAMLLKQWGFSDNFVHASKQAYIWNRKPSQTPDYIDLIQVALMYSNLVAGEKIIGPSLMQLPAFERLNLGHFDPNEDFKKIKELSDRIEDMMASLG